MVKGKLPINTDGSAGAATAGAGEASGGAAGTSMRCWPTNGGGVAVVMLERLLAIAIVDGAMGSDMAARRGRRATRARTADRARAVSARAMTWRLFLTIVTVVPSRPRGPELLAYTPSVIPPLALRAELVHGPAVSATRRESKRRSSQGGSQGHMGERRFRVAATY